MGAADTSVADKNIVELAAVTSDLSTLVVALKASKLTGTLSGQGPFTVFAPSNEAFAKLDKALLDKLLEPKNIGKLTDLLTYHGAAGAVKSTDLKNGERVKTLEGKRVEASIASGHVKINDAQVIIPDVLATNGVVHIIDTVLIPQGFAPPPNSAIDHAILV